MPVNTTPYPGLDRERFRLALVRRTASLRFPSGLGLSQVLGISPLEASRMLSRGHICSVDNFLKACQWMQMSPISFLADDKQPSTIRRK